MIKKKKKKIKESKSRIVLNLDFKKKSEVENNVYINLEGKQSFNLLMIIQWDQLKLHIFWFSFKNVLLTVVFTAR